ncbi:hypothetical protein BDK51DRAFT_41311 [Blyttiomyces helicus]|uniref:Uncharacterized protein n=1 Tax=Blyttiomyces helicus TaxID=388810 RepID=A0A4P9WPC1_9FUNG|nr:hypothetical protein BDK51DRAFT_41311 [Blyttiomyces helicus]|eukprot:RKO92646.1 hypothetical protein BDK51DRAFT_41311 [Blyttiomyces helicus]
MTFRDHLASSSRPAAEGPRVRGTLLLPQPHLPFPSNATPHLPPACPSPTCFGIGAGAEVEGGWECAGWSGFMLQAGWGQGGNVQEGVRPTAVLPIAGGESGERGAGKGKETEEESEEAGGYGSAALGLRVQAGRLGIRVWAGRKEKAATAGSEQQPCRSASEGVDEGVEELRRRRQASPAAERVDCLQGSVLPVGRLMCRGQEEVELRRGKGARSVLRHGLASTSPAWAVLSLPPPASVEQRIKSAQFLLVLMSCFTKTAVYAQEDGVTFQFPPTGAGGAEGAALEANC